MHASVVQQIALEIIEPLIHYEIQKEMYIYSAIIYAHISMPEHL